jgi:hypothetical protein
VSNQWFYRFVMELKIGPFSRNMPANWNFYLSAVDDILRPQPDLILPLECSLLSAWI